METTLIHRLRYFFSLVFYQIEKIFLVLSIKVTMDKSIEKKMKDFICLLQTINESDLPFQPDDELVQHKEYNTCNYYSSICRIHGIHLNGNIKDEFQELFNEKGFAIEREITGEKPFFIRTEKGLIRF